MTPRSILFSAKQNGEVMSRTSLFNAPVSIVIKATLVVEAQVCTHADLYNHPVEEILGCESNLVEIGFVYFLLFY